MIIFMNYFAYKRPLLIISLLLLTFFVKSQDIRYNVTKQPWKDSLGNHRLVISVAKATGAVEVKVDWRRRDKDAAQKVLLITDSHGVAVRNVYLKHIDRERGDFVFEPSSGSGIYYVYYMPWSGHKWEGGFQGDYLHQQPPPQKDWVKRNNLPFGKFQMGRVTQIQSRTRFDSFYPMEIVAKASEVDSLISTCRDDYMVFAENRKNPIKMFDDLPLKWIRQGPDSTFFASAKRNEYYVFQLGVFAAKSKLKIVKAGYKNAPFAMTCFNLGGVDSKGQEFKKQVAVKKGGVQPLWFGVDIPKDAKPGDYTFQVIIKTASKAPKTVHVHLHVTNRTLADRGDHDLWRMSRLRWLNSRLGINEQNTLNYAPLRVKSSTITSTTGSVILNKQGLPASIMVNGQQLLAEPLQFLVHAAHSGGRVSTSGIHFTKKKSGVVSWESSSEDANYRLKNCAMMESDGYLKFAISVTPKKDLLVEDMALQLPVRKKLATYFMGMGSGKPFGRNGGYTPAVYNWKWHGPQNAYWIGTYNAGIYCKLLGATYDGPMLNLYHPAPPANWYNGNKGGFKIRTKGESVYTSTFTGKRLLPKDTTIVFEFSVLITPVKKLDYYAQFSNRYYQNYGNPYPPQVDIDAGVNIINVHHANRVNPYINYPFVRTDSMTAFVKKYHQLGVKTKIYYTIRELSNQCAEIWALRSFGTEIFSDGKGGGYPWLREHLVDHYDVQWFTPIDGYESCDAAIKTREDSRWYNYYIEGLRWLVGNVGIDGLYLDDVAYDRNMLKRMRKVMDQVKPGCLIDLHSNTDFSKGPATQYTEFFPYIDKLWFGENFHYDKMQPDNWMVETAGIPFGLMGDMLFSGGNPWRGLVYGMTARDGWPTDGKLCNPKPIWKVLDDFGIKKATMLGYWDHKAVISTSDSSVLATAYVNVKKGKLLIAIASWDDKPSKVSLNINWKKLGFHAKGRQLVAPPIKDFQPGATFEPGDVIEVPPGKGWLLELQ